MEDWYKLHNIVIPIYNEETQEYIADATVGYKFENKGYIDERYCLEFKLNNIEIKEQEGVSFCEIQQKTICANTY